MDKKVDAEGQLICRTSIMEIKLKKWMRDWRKLANLKMVLVVIKTITIFMEVEVIIIINMDNKVICMTMHSNPVTMVHHKCYQVSSKQRIIKVYRKVPTI